MSEEKRMIGSYEVEHSIHLGDKEVVLGVYFRGCYDSVGYLKKAGIL